MHISASSPVFSFRTAERDNELFIVAAGPAFDPGDGEARHGSVRDLTSFLRSSFDVETLSHLWTSEHFDPMDDLAFAGKASSSPNLFVATGITPGDNHKASLRQKFWQRPLSAMLILAPDFTMPLGLGR